MVSKAGHPAILATAEGRRLIAARTDPAWRRWGPYLSDRQWGTVREDYSADGDAWGSFPHDHARMRAYRWGEDAIAGFGDDKLRWCLGLGLWNGHDPILKERLFGLANAEGNHGEDVKELYYYLDGTPTHSYMRMLYKYPQAAFPYARLIEENRRRGRDDPEFELLDTGLFDQGRYFDVEIEYAKADADDIVMRITVSNRGSEAASLAVVPQLWARNTWSWFEGAARPRLAAAAEGSVSARHPEMADRYLRLAETCTLLFCENETNARRVWGQGPEGYFKDAVDAAIVDGRPGATNPDQVGTKCAAVHRLTVPAAGCAIVRLRFSPERDGVADTAAIDAVLAARRAEADAFYQAVHGDLEPELRLIQRQAFAGLLWSKQFYCYDVRFWLDGDPVGERPPSARRSGRNADWRHLAASDIISMPDAWEYPWFASWDLALQCTVFALIDPDFAKAQLLLLTDTRYMHPNADLPAYEWSFSDANPPLQAWASWHVFETDRAINGTPDHAFLRRMFGKLPLNFTWWANRKDAHGRNVFQGGFLGLDNIGIFDRSAPLPTGGDLTQSDGTAWMAMYALDLLRIAVELARTEPTYEDLAIKFFEHFLLIAKADAEAGGTWDEQDQFFYDVINTPDGRSQPIRTRTMVGLIPIFAVAVLDADDIGQLPQLRERMRSVFEARPDLARLVSRWTEPGDRQTILMSLLRGHRLKMLLRRMLDEAEFLSGHGVRAVSRVYEREPFRLDLAGRSFELDYEPAESRTGLFGGNSNWRGPVWMPVNYLIVHSLRRLHAYYGPGFIVEWPDGSGRFSSLDEVAGEVSRRLIALFRRNDEDRVPLHGDATLPRDDPHFRDLLLFYEYFDGNSGRGVGASHQTGWTGLVALLIAEAAAQS